MWTRTKDESAPGKFQYSLYAIDGSEIETVGGFATAQEADRAAEVAQRIALFGNKAALSVDQIIDSMSDDELVRELLA